MGFFRKKKQDNEPLPIKYIDHLLMEEFSSSQTEYLLKLADHLKEYKPLIGNTGQLDVDDANKTIAFLSGVIYALGGRVLRINETSFMFATEHCYEDRQIINFLENIM